VPLRTFSKPKLIITTPTHAIIERHDITMTILEHARSPYYKEQTRPYLDYRDVLRIHSKHTGRRLLFADLLLRSEEEHARREGIYETYGDSLKRIELPGKLQVVHQNEKAVTENVFQLFLPKVLEVIRETKKNKGHTFLFAARRGLSPVVACIDCGFIFRSPQSGAPYSLIRTVKNGVEERWFVCSSSGHRERAADTCTSCGSWRLRERGIGIQHVHDELVKIMKDTPIILFDHTTAGTFKKACFLRDTFYKTKGAIMLGTAMAIPYLTEPIETSVIVNMDALYATPTWRLEEENLALLMSLREITEGNVYIQTRSKDVELITHAKHAAIEHFYNEEIELRKTFNYPPFTIFIHLTWQGTPEVVKKIEGDLTTLLAPFSPSFYVSPPSPKSPSIHYCLMRMAAQDWPDQKLVTVLRTLPSVGTGST
jgi:primosomal protein N' (replication factor Y)